MYFEWGLNLDPGNSGQTVRWQTAVLCPVVFHCLFRERNRTSHEVALSLSDDEEADGVVSIFQKLYESSDRISEHGGRVSW